jgi:hypothetical protein
VNAADELSQIQEYLCGYSTSTTALDQIRRLETASLRLMEASRMIEGVIEIQLSEQKPATNANV